jgi:hypothetical protein
VMIAVECEEMMKIGEEATGWVPDRPDPME